MLYEHVIKCMVYQSDGLYIAVCLNFSLASQSETPDEAINKLEAQIIDHLSYAHEHPEFATDLLYKRKAPLGLWLRYYKAVIRHKLLSSLKDSDVRPYRMADPLTHH